jgi:hypothetical protein
MRVAVLVLLVAIAWPARAPAALRPECRRLTRQIEHYQGVAKLARERGNALWERETRRHVAELEARRIRRCPQFAPKPSPWARAKEFLAKAASAAASYFTMR